MHQHYCSILVRTLAESHEHVAATAGYRGRLPFP
jgi:hypothetical protein